MLRFAFSRDLVWLRSISPISFRVTSLALGPSWLPQCQWSNLKNMSKSITWINYLGIHNAITTNHSTAKLRAYLMHYTSNILSPNEAICFVYKTHQTASHGKPTWIITLHAISPLLQFEENQSVTPCVSKSQCFSPYWNSILRSVHKHIFLTPFKFYWKIFYINSIPGSQIEHSCCGMCKY